jgi:hypothetical protein
MAKLDEEIELFESYILLNDTSRVLKSLVPNSSSYHYIKLMDALTQTPFPSLPQSTLTELQKYLDEHDDEFSDKLEFKFNYLTFQHTTDPSEKTKMLKMLNAAINSDQNFNHTKPPSLGSGGNLTD